jgi:farnesyl diphosphate synthase
MKPRNNGIGHSFPLLSYDRSHSGIPAHIWSEPPEIFHHTADSFDIFDSSKHPPSRPPSSKHQLLDPARPRLIGNMPTTLKEFESVFPKLVEDLKQECGKYKLPEQALKWFEQVHPPAN